MYMTCLHEKDLCTLETLGSRLRDLREARHLKQEQVALLLNTTRSTICTYEKDARQPPYDMLIRLADFYRVSTDYLLGRQVQNPDVIDLGELSPRDAFIIRKVIAAMEERDEEEAEEETVRDKEKDSGGSPR